MEPEKLFKTYIEPSAEKIGLFGISWESNFNGRECVVTHKISRNVFTDFDGKLSRYLAAVSGIGLPTASIETRFRDSTSGEMREPYPARHIQSVTDALATAARIALGDAEKVRVRMGAWVNDTAGPGREWEITKETIESLDQAMMVCRQIGSVEFLEISGSLERVLVRPRDSDLGMATINLRQGTIDIPEIGGAQGSTWTGPIFSFEKAAAQVPAVINYLGRAQHAVATAQVNAILTFREAAEQHIMNFNAALAGRPLADHRLERATSLIARLKAGLGGSLLGLSESAQMTALDWVAHLDETTKTRPILVR